MLAVSTSTPLMSAPVTSIPVTITSTAISTLVTVSSTPVTATSTPMMSPQVTDSPVTSSPVTPVPVTSAPSLDSVMPVTVFGSSSVSSCQYSTPSVPTGARTIGTKQVSRSYTYEVTPADLAKEQQAFQPGEGVCIL